MSSSSVHARYTAAEAVGKIAVKIPEGDLLSLTVEGLLALHNDKNSIIINMARESAYQIAFDYPENKTTSVISIFEAHLTKVLSILSDPLPPMTLEVALSIK